MEKFHDHVTLLRCFLSLPLQVNVPDEHSAHPTQREGGEKPENLGAVYQLAGSCCPLAALRHICLDRCKRLAGFPGSLCGEWKSLTGYTSPFYQLPFNSYIFCFGAGDGSQCLKYMLNGFKSPR